MATVSVIVATRNRRQSLERAIQSVERQGIEGVRLIVADDCSSDGTREWLQTRADYFPFQTRLIHFEQPVERIVARNQGFSLADTEYCMFLDDDDELLPGAIAGLQQALIKAPDAVAAVGARQEFFEAEDYRRRASHPRVARTRPVFDELCFGWSAVSGQVLYRTRVIRQIGAYSEAAPIPCEDRDMWIRLAQHGPVRLIPDQVLIYRYRAEHDRGAGMLDIRDGIVRQTTKHLPVRAAERALKLRRAGRRIEEAEISISIGRFIEGFVTAIKSFLSQPAIFFSPLIGPWVFRRLAGRMARRMFPPNKS